MNLYREYRDAYVAKRRLEAKCNDMKPRLIGYVARHEEPVVKPFGTFSIQDTPTYAYSEKVSKLAEKLAKLKEDERKLGVAKATKKQTLRFLAR